MGARLVASEFRVLASTVASVRVAASIQLRAFALAVAGVSATACMVDWDQYVPLGEGAGGSGVCGTIALLADDFDDGVVGLDWTGIVGSGASVAELDGERVITLPEMTASLSYFDTVYRYDLRDGAVRIEIPTMTNPATNAQVFFSTTFAVGDYVYIAQKAGKIEAGLVLDNAAPMPLATDDYDPTADRWWQIRESDGTIHFETSPDGQAFRELGSLPVDALPVELATVLFGARTDGTETAPGEVHFDNLSGRVAEAVGWCAAENQKDDFEDGGVARVWQAVSSATCTPSETGGRLSMEIDGSMETICGYRSSQKFDLRGSEVFVEVPTLADGVPAHLAALFVGELGGEALTVAYAGDQLLFQAGVAGASSQVSIPYSSVDHRWWRISENGGTTTWSTSPDGIAWTTQDERPNPVDPSALAIFLLAGVIGPGMGTGVVEMDNLNRTP